MCFSAEASFTASVFLAAAGSATIRNSHTNAQFFIAVIPILFAIQQFSEGLVWLHLSHDIGSQQLFFNAQVSFLTFAFMVWPIWIPLAMALNETITWRRNCLYVLLLMGFLLSGIFLTYGLHEDVSVRAVNHSLQYTSSFPNQDVLSSLYALIVLIPLFISSFKNVWLFGLLIAISYALAEYFYSTTFVSVWCFFSGIVSICIYKILRDYQHSYQKELKK